MLSFFTLRPSKRNRFDAFISYRRRQEGDTRSSGEETARLIRERLQKQNIKSFLDVDDLRSHYFDERLYHEIENSTNFILILTPGCLDRCINEGDWLRKEILHAIKTEKNIIPILKDGFSLSCLDNLKGIPSEFLDLPRHNAIPYSHEYFDSMIDKLVSF